MLCPQVSKTKRQVCTRSRKCIFVGYPFGKKAWKVYDLDLAELFVSRDVVFYENNFPCADKNRVENMHPFDLGRSTVGGARPEPNIRDDLQYNEPGAIDQQNPSNTKDGPPEHLDQPTSGSEPAADNHCATGPCIPSPASTGTPSKSPESGSNSNGPSSSTKDQVDRGSIE